MLTRLFIITIFWGLHTSVHALQQDPTRPPSVIAQQLAPLQEFNAGFNLSAIFTRNAQRYAVVNGEILKQGDEIMGMKISTIDASNVTLTDARFGSEDIVLQVQKGSGMSKQVVK
ncbi:hypothetical protein [Glaciecola sp. SC05]|uniref:hypothetical protein n=1 Tax=Glaciecola sp. SC05 TaxID=1987355 RepID=UPI00352731DE